MTILEDFLIWICGINEDDPLPYEVRYVYFLITFSNNICSLCYCGSENFDKQIQFEYFPLESQFFYNPTFCKITEENLALSILKQLLEDSFDNKQFAAIFEQKIIHFGVLGQSLFKFDR